MIHAFQNVGPALYFIIGLAALQVLVAMKAGSNEKV